MLPGSLSFCARNGQLEDNDAEPAAVRSRTECMQAAGMTVGRRGACADGTVELGHPGGGSKKKAASHSAVRKLGSRKGNPGNRGPALRLLVMQRLCTCCSLGT